MSKEPIDLTNMVGTEDRDLIVAAIQALHLERVAAWNSATSFAHLHGKDAPDMELFGINEAVGMLHRLGAAPSSF
ncbi:hypothetical protein AAG587_17110 [Vreelandella neptunia]|uniref:hypothetical protein n=1 Tax=Vreelandella neptunia TaxID=115551 RepID=UPI003159EDA4